MGFVIGRGWLACLVRSFGGSRELEIAGVGGWQAFGDGRIFGMGSLGGWPALGMRGLSGWEALEDSGPWG